MANMNFSLSSSLTSQLSQPGVYAYAFAFQGSTYTSQTTLVSNGVVQPAANLSLDLGTAFSSGAVYVVIQQGGNGTLPATLISGTNPLGNINPTNATTNNYSYQLFEATLSGKSFDQGDISALNTFGLPSSFSVSVNGAPVTLGFAPGQTGTGIYTALNNTQTFNPNTFASADRLAIGPATTANAAPFSSADWTSYVNNLKTNAAALADITLVVPFAGGTSLQSNPMLSQYGLQYVASDSFGTDYFWLAPNNSNGATNTDWIRIPASQLMQNIYIQPGPLEVHPDNGSGGPSTSFTNQTSFTPNNADGAVAKYLISGFDAGYWGGSGTSATPNDPTISDLNKTWNWNVNYAYNATLTNTAIKYSNTLGTGPGTTGGNNRFYDPWAQEIQKISNAYGYSYTDLVSSGGVNPQITLWDPSQNGGKGGNVANIDITLFSNSEPLTSTSGYQAAPAVYIPPTGSTYSAVNTPGTSGIGFAFQYGLGNLKLAPNGATPAVFKFYAPGDAMADQTTGLVSLSIPSLQGYIGTGTSNPETSNWNVLYVTGGPGNWSLGAGGAQNPYSQQQGFFSVNNVPVTSDGTTGWYQLVFGGTGAQTVYNIYAGSNTTTHQFLPITGPSSNPNNFVVDHGVGITQATPTLPNYTLSFAPGGAMTYSINTFSAPDTIFGTSAANTLVGTSGDNHINGGSGNDAIHGASGTDTSVTWEPSRNFNLKVTAGSSTITMHDKVGNQGTDTLSSIERIQFQDQTVNATWITATAALPADQIMKVVDLYTAGLNRAPDALGLDYYASNLASGMSLSAISKAFFSSAEAAPIYTSSVSTPIFVSMVYVTALGRAPDAAGAAYWASELETGNIQRTDFVTALIAGARAPGGNAADAQYIANKETVGAHFALTQGLNNGTWARTVEAGVDGTAASVTEAKAQTDAFATIAATPATSELVVQIVGLVA